MQTLKLFILKLQQLFPKKLKYIFIKDTDIFLKINSKNLVPLISFFKTHTPLRFNTLIDLFLVDFLQKKKKIVVFYQLFSLLSNSRLYLCLNLYENSGLPSVCKLFFSANWAEREAWDMFGVLFYGHPDLRRILTDYAFTGHPLRKDFALIGYKEIWFSEPLGRVIYVPVTLGAEKTVYKFKNSWKI